ncbi:MAG: thymidine phosphorylase, partial [Gordonia amarae]
GVVLHAKPGDTVSVGAPLYSLHTRTPEAIEGAVAALDGAAVINPAVSGPVLSSADEDSRPLTRPLVFDRVTV